MSAPTLGTASQEPPRKRRRYTRKKTGCKQCRVARLKCQEGANTSNGHKMKCRRCWDMDVGCWYPSSGGSSLKDSPNVDKWYLAAQVIDWRPLEESPEDCDNNSSLPVLDVTDWDTLLQTSQGAPLGTAPDYSYAAEIPTIDSLLDSIFAAEGSSMAQRAPIPDVDDSNRYQNAVLPLSDTTVRGTNSLVPVRSSVVYTGGSSAAYESQVEQQLALPSSASPGSFPQSKMRTSSKRESQVSYMEPPSSRQSASAAAAILNALFRPDPPPVLSSFTLASFSTRDTERSVVSSFERQGYNDIIAAARTKHNWIFAQLFPRLYALLASEPKGDGVSVTIRQWLHHCLLYLSFAHRANTEIEPARTIYWRTEAVKHKEMASYHLLRAKIRYPAGQWKTNEYLMGFFVRCMGDMLNANTLDIDYTTTFEISDDDVYSFSASLRDMIGLYSTFSFAGTPLEKLTFPHHPLFPVPDTGSEWVENFTGFSRRLIILLGKINTMVAQRYSFIRAGTEGSAPSKLLRAQAEKLVLELGESWGWDETVRDLGRPPRIQARSEVMRSALQILLLAEVLEVDLRDPRLASARERAIELVADSDTNAMGGYQCPINIVAVYTPQGPSRDRILEILRVVVSLSFGVSYKGTEDILSLCWEVLDNDGKYEYGIAPWREATTALGKSVFV